MINKHILIVIGTRPEAIKLAPLILELQKEPYFTITVCVTGQHKEMVLPIFSLFNITIDYHLDVMTPNQTLATLTASILSKLSPLLTTLCPDMIIVQGDTTTTFATSLSAFYHAIPIYHIEAGLRTQTITSPWPEEANRQLTSKLARLHAAPTESDKENLLNEGVDPTHITVSGNTVIDALFMALTKKDTTPSTYSLPNKKIILVTCHRRENIGTSLHEICKALHSIATHFQDHHIVFPVHLNPNVYHYVHTTLGNHDNITLLEPLDYISFVQLMSQAYVILTDSGGIQEEAPSLHIPVLIMRNSTERPQAITAGAAQLVGTTADSITTAVKTLLHNPDLYEKMTSAPNPFGDGSASKKISSFLKHYFNIVPS